MFYETVHAVNAADYTPEQLNVWADGNPDIDRWNAILSSHYALVARDNGIIIGFGDIDDTGYLDHLYVHHMHQGRGIAAAITDTLEQYATAHGQTKIITHASITAKPFFIKRGYAVIREQQVERKGIMLTNFMMEKSWD